MKVDRRSFLSFVIGGAAGTALSPLPWKLTDDISIWSQMWPWTPVPQTGEVTYEKSACSLCPGGCGILVRKVDERVVKIEGLPGHPVNDGGVCILGLTGPQLLYGHRRVKSPLKKVNGRFREVSWDEAIADVSAALNDLRDKGAPQRLALITDHDRGTISELFKRFLTVYGSPNFMRTPSMLDAYELTMYLMQGATGLPGFDLFNADYVLSFGSGLLDGWGSPVYAFRAHSHWLDNKSKFVQFESRLSNTAAKSGNWVAINPGTEGALALGLAHVMIRDNQYSREFVDGHTEGFEAFKRVVLDGFTPQIVAKRTGVGASMINKLAREFASAKRPLAITGRGRGVSPGGLMEFMAVHALNALSGNLNLKGGLISIPEPAYIEWPEVQMDAIASAGMQNDRVDGAGTDKYPLARYLATRLPEMINSSGSSPLDVLFIAGANPCYSLPDTAAVREALDKIPMIVSFSSYMNESAEMADYILPDHTYLERYEDIPLAFGFPRPIIGLTKPAVEPQFNTRHTGDVIMQIANSLGGFVADAFAWDDYDTCLQETLADRWDTLVEDGYWVDTEFEAPAWTDAFETDSDRFEFINAAVSSYARYAPVKPEGDETAFPLVLIPFDTMRLSTLYTASAPYMVKAVEDTVLKGNDVLVEINPATARSIGLKDGSKAELTTPKGSVVVRVYLYDGIQPGLVALPRGLGHTAYDRFLAGKGVNYNQVVGPMEDAASGHDAAWGIRAKLTRA